MFINNYESHDKGKYIINEVYFCRRGTQYQLYALYTKNTTIKC